MCTPSKTIIQHEYEKRMRENDPIGYAIKDHENTHHNKWFSGSRPSKSLPPIKKI